MEAPKFNSLAKHLARFFNGNLDSAISFISEHPDLDKSQLFLAASKGKGIGRTQSSADRDDGKIRRGNKRF